MRALTRSAMVQARVYPPIKLAAERVLSRIGMTMSEAMELFLRRLIVEERLPFEVIALEDATLEIITSEWTQDGDKRKSRGKRANGSHSTSHVQ
jgi:DNA-damage-inducible protein J